MLDRIVEELKGNKKQERHFQSNVRSLNANLVFDRSGRRTLALVRLPAANHFFDLQPM